MGQLRKSLTARIREQGHFVCGDSCRDQGPARGDKVATVECFPRNSDPAEAEAGEGRFMGTSRALLLTLDSGRHPGPACQPVGYMRLRGGKGNPHTTGMLHLLPPLNPSKTPLSPFYRGKGISERVKNISRTQVKCWVRLKQYYSDN